MSLKVISEMLGVSTTTVSLALRDHPKISAARREQIKRVAAKLDYRPDFAARVMQGQRTATIGLIWSISGAPQIEDIIRAFTARLQCEGYMPVIIDSLGDPALIENALAEFTARKVDGVVCHWRWPTLPKSITRKLAAFSSAVVISPFALKASGAHLVIHDIYDAIHHIAEHLISRGRRSPLMLMSGGMIDDKVATFREAYRRHDIKVPADDVLIVPMDGEAYRASTLVTQTPLILDARFPPGEPFPHDAVFCRSDEVALAVMAWLRDRGVRVPDDVAVVGMSNVACGMVSDPPLSTVDGREREVIDACLDLLMTDLATGSRRRRKTKVVRIPRKFVVRRSAG